MNSLKERQSGKVSIAAVSASKKEEDLPQNSGFFSGGNSFFTRLGKATSSQGEKKEEGLLPELYLPDSDGLKLRLGVGIIFILLLFLGSSASVELILALSTIGVFISQIRRGRRALPSLGWSVVLLAIGLILGGLLFNLSSSFPGLQTSLSQEQLEALPALLLVWAGALLLG